MHCNALIMLYQKDGPLRRSSECIGLQFSPVMLYQKDSPLRSSDHFFAKCMLQIFCRKYQTWTAGGRTIRRRGE